MLLSSLLLLLFGGATATFHFEIDGHFSEIAVSDVDVAPSRRDHFLPAESKLREKMFDLFKGQLDEFYVHTFSIHGQDLHPSAIFTAFLSTPLPRAKVIHLVSQDEDLDFFRVRELAGLPSPPIPSNSDAVSSCQNGGYLLPNNSCACPAFFVGESCEVVTCLNGGISDRGRCACPPGAYALNCEQRGCLPSTQADLDFSRSSFILVVSQKSTMAYVLNQLANSLGILLGDIFADARFDSYIVVNYVHTKNSLQMSTNVFKRYGDLSNYLNTLVYGLQGREKQPTQRAVLQAQSFYPLMKAFSDVFVFTDSLDEDAMPASYFLSNMTIENQLILQTLAWRNKIHYYFSENGGENLYDKGDGYDTFVRVAKATLGDIFNYPMTEIRTLMNTIDFYNGCQTLAAAYNVTNELTFDLRIPGGSEQGPIFVFLTVAAGTLPKVTDGSRRAMNPILNGSRYEVYNTTSLNKQIIVHPGGKLVSLRACISSGETMLLSAAYSEDTDVGTVYLSANYNNHLTGLSVGNQDYINQVQWLNLQNQQPLSDSVRIGEPRTIECTYNVAFNSLGPCLSMTMGQEVSMTSDKGEIVTRLLPGFCLNMDKQEVQLFMCHNGGTREGVKVCRCTAEWEGPQCETPVCKNKGKTNNFPGNGFGPCSCAPGFSGDHCSVLNCTVPTSYPPPPPTATLALVLQSSLSQASVAPTVDSGVADLLRSMKGDEQYDQFVLTTFSFERTPEQIKNVISTTSFTDSAAFQTAVNSVRYLSTPSTTQDSLGALMSTFNNSMTNSALFLFVDADPWDTSRLPDVLTMSVERNVPINVVVTAPFGLMDQCMTGVSQLFYENLAMKSGGVVLNLCQKTIQRYPQDPIYALFVGYAASHHRTEIINQEFYADFELIPTVFFPVDQPGNDVFVIVNCPKTESVATSIENHDLGFPTPTGSVVYMPFLAVYKVATTAVNKNGYTATVSKSGTSVDGPCNVQAVIKSNHAAHLRFSPNPSFDALQGAIDFAIPTFPVFHISNPKLNRTYSPTLVATDDKGSFTYVGDSLTRTNSCTFEYWFQQEFTCTKPADSFVLRVSLPSFTSEKRLSFCETCRE